MNIDPKNLKAIQKISAEKVADCVKALAACAEGTNAEHATATLGFLNDDDIEETEATFEGKLIIEVRRL